MREDCDLDDLVDVIEGSRIYIPAIYVINKIDQVMYALHYRRMIPCQCTFEMYMP